MDRYIDSSRHVVGSPSVVLSRLAVGGGPSSSSAASGIFFQGDGDGHSPAHASSVSGNNSRSGIGHASGDMNHGPMNSTANSSAPSIGASSLVTDANSSLSGGAQLQRSTSINNESCIRLPASPMSFSSNNIDGSSIIQYSPHCEQMKQGDSINMRHVIKREPGMNLSDHTQKKPRLDARQDEILQQQVIHQLLQRQDSVHQNPQLNAIIQQQRLQQQQQRRRQQQQQQIQSMPHMQWAPLVSQNMRPNNLQVQAVPPVVRHPSDSGLCARRLMQYMYHQRHRPSDNQIFYWRKFVAEYFAPRAKKRWCLSLYENAGNQALGAFPQAAIDAWQCDICCSKSGKGFEATYEVLPRLSEIKFDRGVVDELLFLDLPREGRTPSGMMVLEYGKAVQETVYEQVRVIREGLLRIIFTPDLKILSWEFCARRHEEFFSRRSIVPQVNQLLQVAHKYQTATIESGTAGLPLQDMQASCNMFMHAGRRLVKSLELQSLNEMGFSKRYVRYLQISEVVNIMKDLIDLSQENKIGPIESLNSYPRQSPAKQQALKLQEMEQMANAQGLSAYQSTLNKLMAMHHPGLNQITSNNHNGGAHILSNNSLPPNNNYQYLSRTLSTPNHHDHLPSSSFTGHNQPYPIPFLSKALSVNGFPHRNNHPQPTPQSNNPNLDQHVIQQLFHELMNNNNKGAQQLTNVNRNAAIEEGRVNEGLGMARNDSELGNNGSLVVGPSRSNNSFKSAANNNSSSSSSSFSGKQDLLQNLHFPELDQDIMREFSESGIQW